MLLNVNVISSLLTYFFSNHKVSSFDLTLMHRKKISDILYKQMKLYKPFCYKHKQSLESAWQPRQNSWW